MQVSVLIHTTASLSCVISVTFSLRSTLCTDGCKDLLVAAGSQRRGSGMVTDEAK